MFEFPEFVERPLEERSEGVEFHARDVVERHSEFLPFVLHTVPRRGESLESLVEFTFSDQSKFFQ